MLKFPRIKTGELPLAATWNQLLGLVERLAAEMETLRAKGRPRVAKWAKTTGVVSGRPSDLVSGSGPATLYTSQGGTLTPWLSMTVYNRATGIIASGVWVEIAWVDDDPYVVWEECEEA